MNITVILCTYNRCELLSTALDSVAVSILPDSVKWEVLVVDNNSSDQTREVVESYRRQYPGRFQYLLESQQGKSHALNAGIAKAKGDVLAFIDDDVTVEPMWLQNLTAPLQNGEWSGSGGRIFPKWTCAPPNWLQAEGWTVTGPLAPFDRGSVRFALAESPVGTNMAFQKSAFKKYGGFRTDLGPCPGSEIRSEDSEFCRRLLTAGERICYEPSAVVYHSVAKERLSKRYFLDWWFDKGRSEIREFGVPQDTNWLINGIPLYLFRRLTKWGLRWIMAMNARVRFDCKVNTWWTVGRITECYRLSRSARKTKALEAAGLRQSKSENF